ncbi:putative pterin-4-alpha-carbinolamine dehydratase [Pelagophyceae sp. CCMP2097]|nr:putative pterin-4-alpha-carbinolamine dehydratase [Pelagophyceae sp. CCMP2097]
MTSLAFGVLGVARFGAALARRPLQTCALDPTTRGAFLASAARRGWARHETRDAVAKQFRFDNFSEAWGFMSRIALFSEALDHHPEWSNVYGTVDVVLTTHSAGGLSNKDEAMADFMDLIYAPETGTRPGRPENPSK